MSAPRSPSAHARALGGVAAVAVVLGIRQRSRERRARFLASMGPNGPRPKDFPQDVIAAHRAIEASAERARRALLALPRCYRAAIKRAALGFARSRPENLTHRRSRQIVALASTLWTLSRRSRRHGMRRVVQGYTASQLCTLSLNPYTGRPLTRSAYVATSWGARRHAPDDCGVLAALTRELDGDPAVVFAQQPAEGRCDPRYLGPPKVIGHDASGRPITRRFGFNVYWFRAAADPPRTLLRRPELVDELRDELDELRD